MRNKDGLILLLIVILGAALRLFRLDAQGLWYDELFSVAHSVRPLPELIRILAEDVAHPPLHNFVLRAWFLVAGYGSMQARLVSVIFGTLSIPLLFLLARRFAGPAAGLCAAFLLAVSQMGVYFSQEARGYALLQFLSLMAALVFLSFLQKPDLLRSFLFALLGLAMLYTHYYGASTLLALGLYWLIFRKECSPLVFPRLTAIAVALGIACIPWIFIIARAGKATKAYLFTPKPTWSPTLYSPIGAFNHFHGMKLESIEGLTSHAEVLLGLAVFASLIAAALWLVRGEALRGVLLGCLLSATPVVVALLVGVTGAIFNYRHYSFAIPGYFLAIAIGWRLVLRNSTIRFLWLAIASLLCVLALRPVYFKPTKPDYRQGFLPLAEHHRPGDCVAGQPRVWRNRIHYAWEVYYGDRAALRLVPFHQLPDVPSSCRRLWLIWDRTWWMNANPQTTAEAAEMEARLRAQFEVERVDEHEAIRLVLLRRVHSRSGTLETP